jgi:hypothetical protein
MLENQVQVNFFLVAAKTGKKKKKRCFNNPQEQEELDAPTIVDKTIITRNDEYELLDYWINMRVTKFIQENYFN